MKPKLILFFFVISSSGYAFADWSVHYSKKGMCWRISAAQTEVCLSNEFTLFDIGSADGREVDFNFRKNDDLTIGFHLVPEGVNIEGPPVVEFIDERVVRCKRVKTYRMPEVFGKFKMFVGEFFLDSKKRFKVSVQSKNSIEEVNAVIATQFCNSIERR